jgi:hypothetical protein
VWLNDYRLACQLGGATSDEVIIPNLPLHLADSARTWLEHLPASQMLQPAQENTVLSPKTDPLWSLSNNKVPPCRKLPV